MTLEEYKELKAKIREKKAELNLVLKEYGSLLGSCTGIARSFQDFGGEVKAFTAHRVVISMQRLAKTAIPDVKEKIVGIDGLLNNGLEIKA